MSALRGLWVLSVLCVCSWPNRTQAQAAWLVFTGETAFDSPETLRVAEQFLAERGITRLGVSAYAPAQGTAEPRLKVLVDAEAALADARAKAAALDEQAALETLLSAERALLASLDIPGAHAWLSEVWIAMAVIAAQRAETDLARSLLSRAATLDPARHLLAAEAAPAVVELAEDIARARDAAPRGRFFVQTNPSDAVVQIDGEVADPTRELVLSPGIHLLQVRALGHFPYAALIDVLSGTRSPLSVRLSQHPLLTLSEALENERDPTRVEPLARTLAQQSAAPVWVFARGRYGRLVGSRCVPDGCAPEAFFVPFQGSFQAVSPTRDPLSFLAGGAKSEPHESRPHGRKLWPWITAASLAVVATAISVSLATRDPTVREERTLVVDPGEVR